MKVLLTIVIIVIIAGIVQEIGDIANNTGTQPHPIASILPLVLMGLALYYIIRRARQKSPKGTATTDLYRQRPPTDRQMAFIDALMQEREVETWMLEKEPETIQEASELIEKLKKRPIRLGEE